MAGITAQGTTFNLPNYDGALYGITPDDTPLLAAIGGLTGGKSTSATVFNWSTYDLRSSSANNSVVEGAAAPTAEGRVRATVHNVCEIHHHKIDVSYTKQAATGQFASNGSTHTGAVNVGASNAVTDEVAWQIEQALKSVAIDVEKSFLHGSFSNPATNATARKTRGLTGAISTNLTDLNNATIVDEEDILDLMQSVWQSGGIQESGMITLISNATLKRRLTKIFITDKDAEPRDRNIGGVNLTSFETDFGRVNIMLDRHLDTDTILVVSLDELAPVWMEIPGKGKLFAERLSTTGASESWQLYGEVGLEYGLEQHHGAIVNADVSADT
jgi:hypothetical protein